MAGDPRFRRPADKELLLSKLVDEGPFSSLIEAMQFAAALGAAEERRIPFDKSGESIRYALMENRRFGDLLVDMIAAHASPDDPEVMRDDRLEERIAVFEEYSNGGLEALQGELNIRPGTVSEVVTAIVAERLQPAARADVYDDLSDGLEWTS